MEHALDSHELLRRRAAEARAEFTDAARTAALGVMRARPLAGLVRRQLWLSLSAAAALGVTAGLAAGFAGRRGRRRARWAKAVLLEQSGDGSRRAPQTPLRAATAAIAAGAGGLAAIAATVKAGLAVWHAVDDIRRSYARTRHGGTHDWTWAPDRMGSRHARSKVEQGPIGGPRGCD